MPPGNGEKGHSWQASERCGRPRKEPQLRVGLGPWQAGRQAGRSLLTIDHHVVAQDTGRVEGPFSRALKPIPSLQCRPHAPIHMEQLSGVHPHGEPMGEGTGRAQGRRGLWLLRVVCSLRVETGCDRVYVPSELEAPVTGSRLGSYLGALHNLARAGHQAGAIGMDRQWKCGGQQGTEKWSGRMSA